jgi:hypothetical protein
MVTIVCFIIEGRFQFKILPMNHVQIKRASRKREDRNKYKCDIYDEKYCFLFRIKKCGIWYAFTLI